MDFTIANHDVPMSNTKNLYTAALEQAFHHANDFLGHLDTDPGD
jgi:hypothetical protein